MSDKNSGGAGGSQQDRCGYPAGRGERQSLSDSGEPPSAFHGVDRGTSLSDGFGSGGGGPGGYNAGGGASGGKDQLGLSFEYGREKLAEAQKDVDDAKGRSAAAEQSKGEQRSARR
jgi:hypothetical protein